MDPSPSYTAASYFADFGLIFFALFLVLLNGFFVAAEFAMVKLRATKVEAIAQQNGLSVDGLRKRMASDGMSFDDFRRSLGDEITLQRLRQNFARSRINVSEAEVDAAMSQQAKRTP